MAHSSIQIPIDRGDDPQFIDLVGRAIDAELESKAAQEVFVIRIDNWFDHKWLNFSGKGRVAFDNAGFRGISDTAVDEFRQKQTTFPPFSPNRIVAEHLFTRSSDGSYDCQLQWFGLVRMV